jgi:hypothetical protein
VAERIGVYVLGMHRSGTSALARVIDLLGVPLAEGRMLAPSDANPAGYWEPELLVNFNEFLLKRLGGSWNSPPPLEITAHGGHVLREHASLARDLFQALHPGDQWAWKDPRNCLLLPFWRTVVDDRAVVVIAHRDPAEVAASLGRRASFAETTAIALWERYARSAMFASRDLPRLVVDYADLVGEPVRAVSRVGAFLAAHGLRLSGEEGRRRAAGSVDDSLYGERRAPTHADVLTGEQRELLRQLSELARGDGIEVAERDIESTQQ